MSALPLRIDDRAAQVQHWLAALTDAAGRRHQADLDCARALAEIERLEGFHVAGCASVGELGERHAIPAQDARDLLDLGRALEPVPQLAALVEEGRVTPPAAACVGRVLTDPRLQREGDDWFGWAQTQTTQQIRRLVWKRLEEARPGRSAVVPFTVFVRPQGVADFRRARAVASRRAGKALSNGETLESLADVYLSLYDIQRRPPGTRRLPDTTLVHGRYVPMAVKREVYERQGGRCAVPYCENDLFLDFAHLVPHAVGGSREADNLLLLCSAHHLWFDMGSIRLAGTAAKPTFLDENGRDLTERFRSNPTFAEEDVASRDPSEYEYWLGRIRAMEHDTPPDGVDPP